MASLKVKNKHENVLGDFSDLLHYIILGMCIAEWCNKTSYSINLMKQMTEQKFKWYSEWQRYKNIIASLKNWSRNKLWLVYSLIVYYQNHV